jgi:nitrate reductase delta subunit
MIQNEPRPVRPKPRLRPDELTIAWQCAALMLNYPDETLLDRLDLIRSAAVQLPPSVGAPLRDAARELGSTPLEQLQEAYVETFDNRRRCNLFLTYFTHGDTRKRGLALLRFKQTYLRAGFRLDDSELPDHVCVVLEFAATVDRDVGRELMLDHRAGLELLRLSLRDLRSPWLGAVEAVVSTMPPLGGDERAAIRRLALAGPPEEEVGLAPFAGAQFSAGTGVSLPMPSFPGARS